tara:strand:- start:51 stop:491 length:441 start_codon:yes stop_codon:yes gene_type:complete
MNGILVIMTKTDPSLKELYHQDGYTVVEPGTLLPEIAGVFAKNPDTAVLVFNRKKNKFIGVMYLYDFLELYGNPPSSLGALPKAKIEDCVNTNIISIDWNENVSQAWAKINKYKPKAVLLHDENEEFAGYISNEDIWNGLEQIQSD